MGSDPMDEDMLITRAAKAYGRFATEFREVVDGACLKANGYAVAKKPHGKQYALFALGEKLSAAKVLSDPKADVWVCSSRWTGQRLFAAKQASGAGASEVLPSPAPSGDIGCLSRPAPLL